MNLPISWIIATIFSLALAGTAGYIAYTSINQPRPYQPIWCELEGQTAQDTYSAPDGTPAPPASTVGTMPTDAVTSGVVAATHSFGGSSGPHVISASDHINPETVARVSGFLRDEADGSQLAGPLANGVAKTPQENIEIPYKFVSDSERDGVLGFYRLGLIYLGRDAFRIARESQKTADATHKGLYVPFCRNAQFGVPPDVKESYRYFAMNKACMASAANAPDPVPWMKAIRQRNQGHDAEYDEIENSAGAELDTLMEQNGFDPENSGDRARFCLGVPNIPTSAPRCANAQTALQALNLGKAFYAQGNKEEEARACYNTAIDLAKTDPSGPEAGFQAQRALQNLASSCKWDRASLAAINRDYDARSVDLIRVETLQQALRALSHYDGAIDGQLSPATRAAIRKFQREQGDDETDILSPLQMTQLICSAAETEDLASQTALGVMYILGDGVVQNIDSAQQWLIRAANRHYPDASYNLAMLYGTGIVLDSYRLCDVPRTPEQADRYLAEAADAHGYSVAPGSPACKGQLMAQKLMGVFGPGSKYGALPPSDRWLLIERQALDKIRSGPFANRFQDIGKQCRHPLKSEP